MNKKDVAKKVGKFGVKEGVKFAAKKILEQPWH